MNSRPLLVLPTFLVQGKGRNPRVPAEEQDALHSPEFCEQGGGPGVSPAGHTPARLKEKKSGQEKFAVLPG